MSAKLFRSLRVDAIVEPLRLFPKPLINVLTFCLEIPEDLGDM